VTAILSLITKLYELFVKDDPGVDQENEIHRMLVARGANSKFNVRNLESFKEKNLIPEDTWCFRIKPMLMMYGIVFVSDSNFYFQTIQKKNHLEFVNIFD
jgi:hypothetical protein